MSVFFFDIRKKYTSYTEEIYVKKMGYTEEIYVYKKKAKDFSVYCFFKLYLHHNQ